MSNPPLQHIVRVRSTSDLDFVRPGVMDEVLVNANQLENSVQATAAHLWKTTLPFSIDPVLWKFQFPEWCRNASGNTKANYLALGKTYTSGTKVDFSTGPILDAVKSTDEWRRLASNVVSYERDRLWSIPAQYGVFDETAPRLLRPVRIIAPALVAFSDAEDRVNQLLVDASAEAVRDRVAVQVIVPRERLLGAASVKQLLVNVPTDPANSYFVWSPEITEEMMLADRSVFDRVMGLVGALAARGVPVGYQQGSYSIAALHDVGLVATTHHLGWVDHGDPARRIDFARRSRTTYVPSIRHSISFTRAGLAGRELDRDDYSDRYCECPFCLGAFDRGQHPLDLLLEDEQQVDSRQRVYTVPTPRAVAANTWHYLWSRQLEVDAFSELPAADVVGRDIERAARLLGDDGSVGLQRLARGLSGA